MSRAKATASLNVNDIESAMAGKGITLRRGSEEGKIDGASEWQLYQKIAIPLLKNAQATVIILTFGGIWGDASTSTTYIYKEQLRTLGFFMSTIGGGIARTGAGAASGLIMTLPSIIIFIINQSRVQDTMAHSGIK